MFVPENRDYTITGNGELAHVLANLHPDYIYTLVDGAIKTNLRNYATQIPNAVSSFELVLKNSQANLECFTPEILEAREKAYNTIIDIICNRYNVQFIGDLSSDIYSSAALIYDFFISNFQNNIINFFGNYILREKNMIYDMLNFSDQKKSKDSTTQYNKKLYKNTRLAIVLSNIEYIIENMDTFDISFEIFVNTIYGNNRSIARHILNTIVPRGDFFREYIIPVFNTQFRSILLTDIKYFIMQNVSEQEINTNPIYETEEN